VCQNSVQRYLKGVAGSYRLGERASQRNRRGERDGSTHSDPNKEKQPEKGPEGALGKRKKGLATGNGLSEGWNGDDGPTFIHAPGGGMNVGVHAFRNKK